MTTQIALFRSLNVGGKNVIKMAALTALFVKNGAKNPRAYIQSGNVLFESEEPEPVMQRVSKALREAHAIDVPVTLRNASALREALVNNPFKQGESKLVLVMFLGEIVSKEAGRSNSSVPRSTRRIRTTMMKLTVATDHHRN